MKKLFLFVRMLALAGVAWGVCIERLAADEAAKPWVVVNEDCSTTIAKMAEDELCEAGLRRHFTERLKGPRLTHYAVNPQAMCACYDSKVATPIWKERKGSDKSEPKPMPKWIARLKAFHEQGVDPYRIWMACAREHGVKTWISMRMNDVHCVEEHDRWMCSELWFARPDLRREPSGNIRKWHGDSDGPFDYAKQEAFDFHLAYLQELVDRYGDVADGIECDWIRFPHHLPLGHEREHAAVLTAFMRKVRAIADARAQRNGRQFVVAVRVASSVDAAMGLGTDAIVWAREGLVDVVTPCNFFNVINFNASWSDWKRLLGEANAKVVLLAGMDDGIERRGLWKRESVNAEEAAGYFARAFEAGVTDGVNLFNYFLATKDTPVYRLIAFDGLDTSRVNGMTRRFAYTWCDTFADDTDPHRPFPAALDTRRTFRFDLPSAQPGDRVIVHIRRHCDAAPCAFPLAHALMNGTRPLKVLGPEDVEFPRTAVRRGANDFSVGPAKGLAVNGLEVEFSVR